MIHSISSQFDILIYYLFIFNKNTKKRKESLADGESTFSEDFYAEIKKYFVNN